MIDLFLGCKKKKRYEQVSVLEEKNWKKAVLEEEKGVKSVSSAIKRRGKFADRVLNMLCQGLFSLRSVPGLLGLGQPCFWLRDGDGGKQMED